VTLSPFLLAELTGSYHDTLHAFHPNKSFFFHLSPESKAAAEHHSLLRHSVFFVFTRAGLAAALALRRAQPLADCLMFFFSFRKVRAQTQLLCGGNLTLPEPHPDLACVFVTSQKAQCKLVFVFKPVASDNGRELEIWGCFFLLCCNSRKLLKRA
jgi:hypothetical protein